MAIINKTGITNGGTIQAEHVTRVIDALSSVSPDSTVATAGNRLIRVIPRYISTI